MRFEDVGLIEVVIVAPSAGAKAKRKRPKKRKFSGSCVELRQAPRAYAAGADAVHPRRARRRVYGHPQWERRLDPTSELILTILTQNTADMNAEHAFEALRLAYPGGRPTAQVTTPARAGAATACPTGSRRTGRPSSSRRSRSSSRSSGRAGCRTRRRRASRRRSADPRGARRLLAGVPRRHARARGPRLARPVDGIGVKTASVVLLFSFGLPLMPVDRHVERVARRVGLLPPKATLDEGARLLPGDCSSRTRCTRPTST